MKCRECGCTDKNACALIYKGKVVLSCSWAARNLCTACVPTTPDPRQLPFPGSRRARSAPVVK